MISSDISDRVLTIGPDPSGKGGMASVVRYYRDNVFAKWNFIAETKPGKRKLSKFFDAISVCLKLLALPWSNKDIKIVHIHTAGKVSFPRSCVFMRIAKLMGRKVVLHIHSAEFQKYCDGKENKVSRALNKADAVIVLGGMWRDYCRETLGVENTVVVPNIVPCAAQEFDISERGTEEKVHALFLGQLGQRKGIYDLLEALSMVKEKLRDRFVLHVGGNGEVDRFMSEVSRLSLEGMVVFEGWVTDKKKTDLLKKSSISILPSYFEGLPISLLEGMTYGHALIATNVGSIPEILDSSNGYIIEAGKIEEISQSLLRLVEDGMKLKEMGDASINKVRPHLPDSVADSLSKLYGRLLRE